jgi:outer membrane receptor protein involved in Fe transport
MFATQQWAAPGPANTSATTINTTGTVDSWGKYSIKGDHSFGLNDRVSFLYNHGLHELTPGAEGFPGLPAPLVDRRIDRQNSNVIRGTYDKVITPTIVNHMFGGFNMMLDSHYALTLDGGWEQKGVCLKGAWDCNRNLLRMEYSDYNTWVASAPDGSENFAFSMGDDISISRGTPSRSATCGSASTITASASRPSADWRGATGLTSVPNDNNLTTGGGNGFASSFWGVFSGGTENDRFVGQQWRSHAWYFQDDYKLTPKLTLNYGVRYEFTLPPLEQKDKWSDFDPTKPNPRAGNLPGALRFAGTGPGREVPTITPGWYGGISPRFGLAYGLDSNTVLRASAGRSFGVAKTITGSTHFEGAVIIFRPTSLDNGVTPSFLLDQGLPPYTRPPVVDPSFSNGNNTAYWDGQSVRLPENYQWSFSMQRQVTSTMVLEANYHATIGAHLVA